MLVCLYRCRMISIFPEGTFPLLSLVELRSCPACNQLYRPWDDITSPTVEYDQMDMVRGGHMVEDPESVALFGFEQPDHP